MPPPSPAPYPRLFKERRTTPADNHRLREPEFQAHLALESNSDFRLIPRWNQIPISGSFLDWKMLTRIKKIPGSKRTAVNENPTEGPFLRSFLYPLNGEEFNIGHGHPLGLQEEISQVFIAATTVD